ncbi:hypothetical protein MPSEU_000402500 [Mayamaea pseudoterrestris]|nr:hypothetical protein MPSEU_000402500 [Mayamaea pseudoterrestris]
MTMTKRRNAAAVALGALFVVAAVIGLYSQYSASQTSGENAVVQRFLRDTPRRREQSTITCALSRVEMLISIQPMQSQDVFHCNPIVDGVETSDAHTLELDEATAQLYSSRAEGGQDVTATITNAYIDDLQAQVILSSDSTITFLQADFRKRRRKLIESTGSYSMLVIRVELMNAAPTFSASQLYSYIFAQAVSLKNQYYACSAGKLVISPAPAGAITVRVSLSTGNSQQSVVNAAQTAAVSYLNSVYGQRYTDLHEHADMFMFVLPYMGNWLAYATVGGSTSVYNDKWGGYVASNMHETGHNFGLLHSHEGAEYLDYTGYMGGAVIGYHDQVGFPAMCYNAADLWQLGWYSDRTVAVNLFRPTLIKLAAFPDYSKTTAGEHYVVARTGNVYLHYNRAKGYNINTYEYQDALTIYQKISSGSYLFAALSWTGTTAYARTFAAGTWRAEICDKVDGNGYSTPDYLVVSVGFGNSLCGAYAADPWTALSTYRPV